jgi:trigger factor
VPSTVEQLSPSRVKITVEVPFAELKPSMDKAYREVAQSVNIPGFRRGKVPSMVIDQRFGRGMILQEALNDALPRFYGAAVQENNLTPLAQPEVEVTKLEDGDSIEFTAEVDVRPEFALPDFTEVKAEVDPLEVPDDAVDAQLEILRNRFGSRETVDRPAEHGDVVTIDLVARKDGEVLADGTADGLEYVIGSDQMLDGLDEAVTGLSVDETATFTSSLVGGPHKDEDADIEVVVSKVQRQELPELDNEFAQLASEFDTLEEMRADLASGLRKTARLEQAAQARDAVLEKLLTMVDVEVPEQLRQSQVDARREQITQQLGQAGLTVAEYLADSEEAEDEEQFWADIDQRAGDGLKAQLILDKAAEDADINVGQDDLTQHILRKAAQERTNPQEIASHLQEHPHHIEEYMLEIRRGKALAMIVEAATVTDSDGATVNLSGLQPDGTLASEADLLPVIEATGEPETAAEPVAATGPADKVAEEQARS